MEFDELPRHLAPAYRSALIAACLLNAMMVFGEGGVGLTIGSAALLADAVDFLEDAGIYLLAIIALTWSSRNRALAGGVMGIGMVLVGLVALWQFVERLRFGGAPEPVPLAITAAIALAVNLYCTIRLRPHRDGDASMRGIWLSTRNDAALNLLTILAAIGVAWTASPWPDLAAGAIIAAINLWGAAEILAEVRRELAATS